MEAGWAVLRLLPKNELTRLSDAQIARYIEPAATRRERLRSCVRSRPTRSAALELADERRLMRQGYEFLDEKRMLLATEMLRQLRDLSGASEQLVGRRPKARREALAAAVERHGLDQLQVYPAPQPPAPPAAQPDPVSRHCRC